MEQAYEALAKNDQPEASKELHLALACLQNNPGGQLQARVIIKEIINIYNKLGRRSAARKLGELLLKPAFTPADGGILKAHKIAVRRKAILKAGDQAALKDYLLADLYYSALLPPPTFYEKIKAQSRQRDEMTSIVVDRLVRLFLKNGDFEKAETLVERTKTFEDQLRMSGSSTPESKKRLAFLGIDLALVRMHQKRYSEAAKLFEKKYRQAGKSNG